MAMKCSRCGREITEDESYSYQGQVLCEDCYMEAGLHVQGCDPWATYSATRTTESSGVKGMVGLTEMQRKVHEFIKSRGRVTRDEVKEKFNLSEAEMDAQITPLMHSEMIKEHSEGEQFYLIPIG